MDLEEIKTFCKQLVNTKKIDFLDISLWDSFKYPAGEKDNDNAKTLLEHFTEIDFQNVLLVEILEFFY